MVQTATKRLVLRAVLSEVSPLVARVLAVPDDLELTDLHEVFLAMLEWDEDPGFIIRIHAQEFNSFRRNTRGTRLRDFQRRRQEKFLYICDPLDLWEWELRVLDVEPVEGEPVDIVCLKGCGAAPPAMCGGPTGYRLMLKLQQAGPGLTDPASISAGVKALADAYQNELGVDLPFLEDTLQEGCKRVEERLARSGPLTPARFSVNETNERLARWAQRRRGGDDIPHRGDLHRRQWGQAITRIDSPFTRRRDHGDPRAHARREQAAVAHAATVHG